jgi:hypothetical protein
MKLLLFFAVVVSTASVISGAPNNNNRDFDSDIPHEQRAKVNFKKIELRLS